MTRNVDDIINTATNPIVTFMIATSAISGKLKIKSARDKRQERSRSIYVVALVDVEISVHVPLVGAPNCAGHAGPWLLEGKNTLDVVTSDFLSRDRVDNSRLNSKEG